MRLWDTLLCARRLWWREPQHCDLYDNEKWTTPNVADMAHNEIASIVHRDVNL
jgi:hypothetical protein